MRKWLPVDLLVVILVAFAMLGFETGLKMTPLRIVFGGILTLFAPGYALVSFLMPEATCSERTSNRTRLGSPQNNLKPLSVTVTERFLLAIGLSVIVVPLVGFILNYSPWGLGKTAFITGIAAPTLLLSFGAIVRRAQLPAEERFRITIRNVPKRVSRWYGGSETAREKGLNVILLAGLMIAVVGVGTAIALSGGGEQYTEFYVLSEDPETGEMLADGYPTELSVRNESEFVIGITNQEGETETYTLIVQLDRTGDDFRSVRERTEVTRMERSVRHGETVEIPITVKQRLDGENIRLSYLLYIDAPPDQPSRENAYRKLHLWIDAGEQDIR